MRKPQRPCNEFGCNRLTRESWCDLHKHKAEEAARSYNQYKRDSEINAFYRGTAWQRARRLAMERDNHLCQWCLQSGVLEPARIVHHIVEVKDDWTKRLDLDNLESLCHSCHNRHHKQTSPL